MAKLFTIAEGLENLGALKTGGQGSVYKGKRVGEMITAIKLLPTPVLSEDLNDKNYRGFVNEVEKLKRVNENPNPNVVRIIGSGITETGCFPYIEMEFIEGPDLGELLKPPHDPVFTIQESVKVACHIANALAHCHRCDVKHGDIKSNNIKYNNYTGNYLLLDFGLAIMSDEDRRTSLRHAGAIEFMAPEQNNGDVFFETDVYSFGVVMFELLAGRVPFPLQDSGETARNAVMLSHIETPPPGLLELRKENIPASWEKDRPFEMQPPGWLTTMIYKCLEKKPEDRFRNGQELKEFIARHSNAPVKLQAAPVVMDSNVEVEQLKKEKDELQQLIVQYQKAAEINEEKIDTLQNIIKQHESMNAAIVATPGGSKTVSRKLFYAVLVLLVVLGAGFFYSVISNRHVESAVATPLKVDSAATELNMESSGAGKSEFQPQEDNVNDEPEPALVEQDTTGTVKKNSAEESEKKPVVDTSVMIRIDTNPSKQRDSTRNNKKIMDSTGAAILPYDEGA